MCHSLSDEEEKDPEARIFAVHIARATADTEMHVRFCSLNFPLEGEKKIKKGGKKIGLTKLPHKTFKVLWHHKLKTTSQILCDINM